MIDELPKLIEAIFVTKTTKRVIWQNIVFALGIKGVFLTLGAFGILFTPRARAGIWEAASGDVGVAIIAIFSATSEQKFAIHFGLDCEGMAGVPGGGYSRHIEQGMG
jgi:cation transport ATPase